MSVKRALFGVSGITVTSIGVWLLTGKERESNHYKTKVTRFRNIAQEVNVSLSTQNLTLRDPEHGFWTQRFQLYNSQNWNKDDLDVIPEEARVSEEGMKDFRFEKIEANKEDIKEGGSLLSELSGDLSRDEKFWDHCLDSLNS
ncbi:hypothetical protein HF1_09820 [Mycoplasma haemofelis str. Langford 1]|uniref:Uncharacterized protein n=1 Tax=Mycoplasma haemofelis (strain Langford 1) TaxID=941640 RepID=E8ZIL9_MYCHL|nr:hypothetical protein [Mycoplasma haemofelis]CBY92990.1 hypothetical protein HF1_09820 [Mycoplasma haemofelis str. Langford 1]